MGAPRRDVANRQLAVTHRFTLRVPSAQTEAIQKEHLDQCAQLNCTVLSSSIDRQNEGRITARATVRIRPEAYAAFAVLLAAPPAEVAMHAQSAEDLATPIFDAEKRLAVKVALRDRLTAMLNDASVKTAADLITVEKELAQAQSEIEIITAQRDQLRTRTDTVRVEIYYRRHRRAGRRRRSLADPPVDQRHRPDLRQFGRLADLVPRRRAAVASARRAHRLGRTPRHPELEDAEGAGAINSRSVGLCPGAQCGMQ